MRSTIEDNFQRLKPLCIGLAKQYTIEKLNRLQYECQGLDDVSLQHLQQYLIFPIRLTLTKQSTEKLTTESINFMNFLFCRTKLLSWSVFQDVMGQIFIFVSGPEHPSIPHAASEELKLAICKCAETMVINSSTEIHMQMYTSDFRLPLAQYICGLTELLKNESSKTLRLSALRALAAILYCSDKLSRSDPIITAAGDRAASFLPGVCTALRDIICGDVKQGHAIIVLALRTLSVFMTMVVGDLHVNENTKKVENVETKVPIIARNLKWVKEISCFLKILIQQTVNVVCHEHWKVRLALVDYAALLLCGCSNNLSNCISPLLQLLFTLNVDEYEQVAVASNKALEKFSDHINSVKSFNAILEEDIFDISLKLIKIHLSMNDVEKLALLKMLHGYFQLLGDSVNNLLYSLPHLEKFMVSILNLIKFDYSDFSFLVEHKSISNFATDVPQLWPKHKFRYFDNDEITSRILSVCQMLGYNGDINLLVDYLLEKHSSPLYKNEAVFIINCIIKGLDVETYPLQTYFKSNFYETKESSVHNESKIHIVTVILESLLSSNAWKTFTVYSDDSSSESPENWKENVLQVCLILECIATCSQILKTDFHPFLMEVLCAVMEKAGCGNLMLSYTAKLTLQCIADSGGYSSISHLIILNADYLVNSICSKLHHFISESETFLVLQVAVEYCDSNILSLFKDPIYDLFKTLDLHQAKALPIMKVLKSIVVAVGRWFPFVESFHKKKWVKNQLPKPTNNSLKSLYLEYHHLKKQEMSFLDDDDDSVQHESEEVVTDEPSENKDDITPLHVEIVTQVLDRCVHMMSSKSLELTSLVLEVIGDCILALKNDIDKALPYVHKIWSPLVLRFSENLVVSIKSFETLLIIANECGDFIKARTMKQVWPKLISFLKSQLAISMTKRNSTDYCLTTAYKYQLLLLSEIGNLANKLDLTEKEIEMLVNCCLLYVKKNQPICLQEAAKSTLNSLSSIDGDAVWFHFHEYFGIGKELIPSNAELKHVHFALSTSDVTDDYDFL